MHLWRVSMLIIALTVTVSCVHVAIAYDVRTHRELSLRAAEASPNLTRTLSEDLGYPKGAASVIDGESVSVWIGEGSRLEDDSSTRVLNHFHNPIRAWSQAGLRIAGIPFGLSSVLWGQQLQQDPSADQSRGGTWSWPRARERYRDALTSRLPDDRERAFPETLRALGHLMHLVQDAAVPSHVRNDPHLTLKVFGRPLPDVDPYERWMASAVLDQTRFNALVGTPISPASSVFVPTGDPAAPVPVAGLIDTRRFRGSDPSVLSSVAIGLSEYTNGNFVSKDSQFTADFTYPRRPGLGSQFVEPERNGFRRYFEKRGDGDDVRHFVAEGLLHRSIQQALGQPLPRSFIFTPRVHEEYATRLLPRALGYSTALADYFFRGKLDVDLVSEPTDPTVVRIQGTNASPDAMVAGTLLLYAEDVTTKERTGLTPLDPDAATTVEPNDSIVSGRFQLPANAERFVAVYQGTLGGEVKDGQFPGAVIGQVLGGTRVEQVFSQSGQWRIRTPDGIFPLPITTPQVILMAWGDADNTLVGISPFDRFGGANRFFAWRIKRDAGDTRIPLTAAGEVDVELLQDRPFPFGMSLGTTVELTHTYQLKKYLPAYLHTEYVNENNTVVTEEFEFENPLVLDSSGTVQRQYPLTLAFDGLDNLSFSPLNWTLRRIGMTADGRMVALIDARLRAAGTVPEVQVPRWRYVLPCTSWPCPMTQDPPVPLTISFPNGGLIAVSAVIDVTNARVLTSTAPPVMRLSHSTVSTGVGDGGNGNATVVEARRVVRPDGSRSFVNFPPSWHLGHFEMSNCDHLAEEAVVRIGRIDAYVFGTTAAPSAFFTPELEAANFPPLVSQRTQTSRRCVSNFDLFRPLSFPRIAFTVTTTEHRVFTGLLSNFRRARSSPERVVVNFQQPQRFTGSNHTRVVAWDPDAASARIVYDPRDGRFIGYSGMSRENLVAFDTANLLVIPLESGAVRSFPMASSLADDFVALEGGFVYNTTDLKFYRTSPALQRTALPRTLAPGGASTGDFHGVRLR